MSDWDAKSVRDIIGEIDEGVYVLPVIQRRLVWEEDKMELLFDTLLKNNSFGGVMVIEEEKGSKPLFAFRNFTKDGNRINSQDVGQLGTTHYFVIDGQQRLQSFYIGIVGSINSRVLYFDLFSNYKKLDFDFKFENDAAKLRKYAADREDGSIKEHKWYLASELFRLLRKTNDEDPTAKHIIKSLNITDELQKDHIMSNVKAFYKSIFQFKNIGVAKVYINRELDETENKQRIVELFRRLNDGGTVLSSFDLVASILKGFEWKMESFLDETLKDYKEIGMTQDVLIKLLFLLMDNHSKEMTDIATADADFAVKNKERIINTLKSLKKFLHNAKIYNYYRDGNRSFIPLYFIAYHIFHKSSVSTDRLENYFDNYDTNNADFKNMFKWVYLSLLSGVFKSKGAGWIPYKTGVRKILEKIKTAKNKLFPTDTLFEVYKKHPVVFYEIISEANLINLDQSFLFYVLYDQGSITRSQDIDHIHARSILESAGYDHIDINRVENYQLLDVGTNRGLKNAKPLKDWIHNHVDNRQLYLKKHLIPDDETKWEEKNYKEFIVKRGELLADKINNAVKI